MDEEYSLHIPNDFGIFFIEPFLPVISESNYAKNIENKSNSDNDQIGSSLITKQKKMRLTNPNRPGLKKSYPQERRSSGRERHALSQRSLARIIMTFFKQNPNKILTRQDITDHLQLQFPLEKASSVQRRMYDVVAVLVGVDLIKYVRVDKDRGYQLNT